MSYDRTLKKINKYYFFLFIDKNTITIVHCDSNSPFLFYMRQYLTHCTLCHFLLELYKQFFSFLDVLVILDI